MRIEGTMKDVFLSYASADRERARRLVKALEASGLTVWWDRELDVGQTYDEAIQTQLESSRCVVVLWSRSSVDSHWVKAEAQDAKERNRLYPAFLDPVKPPLEYRYVNGVDLSGWDGSPKHPELVRLLQALRSRTSRPLSPDTAAAVLPKRAAQTPQTRQMPQATDTAPRQPTAPQGSRGPESGGGDASRGPGPVTAIRLATQLGELLDRIARDKRAGRAPRPSDGSTPGDVTLARVLSAKLARALSSVADGRGKILPSRLALRYFAWSIAVPTVLALALHAFAALLPSG